MNCLNKYLISVREIFNNLDDVYFYRFLRMKYFGCLFIYLVYVFYIMVILINFFVVYRFILNRYRYSNICRVLDL